MLRSLFIKNYALIEEFSVEFEHGLNIITGETGAGKSIVLGAFGLLIGDRADPSSIRAGVDKAVVEAEFDIAGNPNLLKFLEAEAIEHESNTLIIRREISRRGSSRGFINDSPATVHVLSNLSEYLVDLHGQHEHQSLLHAKHHIRMLDEFGGLNGMVEEYSSKRSDWIALNNEIAELRSREARLREEHDLFEFQLQEILAVNPEAGEEESIETRLRVLENAEELRNAAVQIHGILYEDEGSAIEKLGVAKEQLAKLATIEPALEEPLREARSALAVLSELSKWIANYSERIELDPQELEHLRDRAQKIQRLKKKFGGSLAAVLEKKAELESKLSFESAFDEIIASKTKESAALRNELSGLAGKLSKERAALAKKLEPQIAEILKELGIEQAKFKVENSRATADKADPMALTVEAKSYACNARGIDTIEFFISTNAGEEPKPLAKVASGGEISRIMLALKTVLAKTDRLPLLVFDEIDIGISGRVAQRVGRAMKRLAEDHQIIAITHLAQIAACGNAHFVAEKTVQKGVTSSRLRRLTNEEHIEEVAKLISGDSLSKSSLDNARTLIEEADIDVRSARKTTKSNKSTVAAL